jgi:hypothetical protein
LNLTFSVISFCIGSARQEQDAPVFEYGLLELTTKSASELYPDICAHIDWLMSSDRTVEERLGAESWLRSSGVKSWIAEIYRTGIDNYPRQLDPNLVAKNLKNLLKSIDGDLVNRVNQKEIIALMNDGMWFTIFYIFSR